MFVWKPSQVKISNTNKNKIYVAKFFFLYLKKNFKSKSQNSKYNMLKLNALYINNRTKQTSKIN